MVDTKYCETADGYLNGLAEKTSPVGADVLLIEDSAASYAKKKVLARNLPAKGSKSITVEDPSASEDLGLWIPDVAVTITSVTSYVEGTTPSVTWNLRHNTDPSAGTADVFTSDPTTTSQTSVETDNSGFNDNTVAAGEAIRLITSAQSGTVNRLHLTINYTVD